MAHYLGLENSANPFVGNSIFERNPQKPHKSLASADIEHYLITADGITASDPQGNNSDEMEYVDYLLKTLRQIERHDRIWHD
jgi:hypothetical protein